MESGGKVRSHIILSNCCIFFLIFNIIVNSLESFEHPCQWMNLMLPFQSRSYNHQCSFGGRVFRHGLQVRRSGVEPSVLRVLSVRSEHGCPRSLRAFKLAQASSEPWNSWPRVVCCAWSKPIRLSLSPSCVGFTRITFQPNRVDKKSNSIEAILYSFILYCCVSW